MTTLSMHYHFFLATTQLCEKEEDLHPMHCLFFCYNATLCKGGSVLASFIFFCYYF